MSTMKLGVKTPTNASKVSFNYSKKNNERRAVNCLFIDYENDYEFEYKSMTEIRKQRNLGHRSSNIMYIECPLLCLLFAKYQVSEH